MSFVADVNNRISVVISGMANRGIALSGKKEKLPVNPNKDATLTTIPQRMNPTTILFLHFCFLSELQAVLSMAAFSCRKKSP